MTKRILKSYEPIVKMFPSKDLLKEHERKNIFDNDKVKITIGGEEIDFVPGSLNIDFGDAPRVDDDVIIDVKVTRQSWLFKEGTFEKEWFDPSDFYSGPLGESWKQTGNWKNWEDKAASEKVHIYKAPHTEKTIDGVLVGRLFGHDIVFSKADQESFTEFEVLN